MVGYFQDDDGVGMVVWTGAGGQAGGIGGGKAVWMEVNYTSKVEHPSNCQGQGVFFLWPNIHWISNIKPYSKRLILDRPAFFNLRKGGREDSAQRVDTIEIRRNTLYVAFDTVVFKVRRGLFDIHKCSARRMREGISAGWLSCISG